VRFRYRGISRKHADLEDKWTGESKGKLSKERRALEADSLRDTKISAIGKLAELAQPSTFQDYQRENYGREGENVAVVVNCS
jgi:hypothetical protein